MWLLLTEVIAQERQRDRERMLAKEQLLRTIRPQTQKPALFNRIVPAIGSLLVRLGTKMQGQKPLEPTAIS